MEKEYFIRWNNGKGFGFEESDGGYGGTVKIEIYTLDRFAIKKVSGSSIPTIELIRLLWSSPIFEDLRKYVSSLKRKNMWGIKTRSGMSGCSDYWIQFLDSKSYSVRQSRRIFHSSMMGSFNEDFVDIWAKDFYDLLWWFEQNHYYEEAFKGKERKVNSFSKMLPKGSSKDEKNSSKDLSKRKLDLVGMTPSMKTNCTEK